MRNKKNFKIENRLISDNHKPLIVPEIGINHGGSIEVAVKIVDAAKRAGAEIIKHQTHLPEDEMSSEAKKIKPGNSQKNIFSIIKSCALNLEDEYKLFKYVNKKKMIFLSTPFSKLAVDRLVKFGVSAFKIGSGEMNNYPLLNYISKQKKPMIISTGMNDIKSVKNMLKNILIKPPIALLHTTNLYPTPNYLVRLKSITDLKDNFPNYNIGLSDHTKNNYSSFGAIALGANIIEKHFVDKKSRKGPDIQASIDEKELSELITGCNILFEQRQGGKSFLKEEQITRNFAFASVVATKNIFKGEKFNYENLWVKRPGSGDFKASDIKKLIGIKAKRNVKYNTQIKKKDVF